MRKFILLGVLLVVLGIFGVCIRQRIEGQRRIQLISLVKSSIQSAIAKDSETYAGIMVGEIVLIKESSHKYTGYVEYKYGNISDKPSLEVSIDSGGMVYRSEPPRALLAKKAADLFQQSYNNGEEARAILEYNDNTAKATLLTLSTACETYAAANNGDYPSDMSDLVNGDQPYLNRNFCNETRDGYTYHCSCSQTEYTFEAVPVQKGVTGTDVYTITIGGKSNF